MSEYVDYSKATVTLDDQTGGVFFSDGSHDAIALHPIWLRERAAGADFIDPDNNQRLYEQAELPVDLRIINANLESSGDGGLSLSFSDQINCTVPLASILTELQWQADLSTPPAPIAWDCQFDDWALANWNDLDDPGEMETLLAGYFRNGFCLIENTPNAHNQLSEVAGRFGFVRDTSFGKIFHVFTKPNPSDIAYTGLELLAHTDNPYRQPVPGIQFLQCIQNDVAGGYSTLVDGLAIAEQLRREDPEQFDILTKTYVRFRYHGAAAIIQSEAPIIELNQYGSVRHVRLSSRVDYVPPLPPAKLDTFYKGRNRLHTLANSTDWRISFPFKPGLLLMMNNYRLLHGRTAFDGVEGQRHLQGCYIDHDGPDSLYRMLRAGWQSTSVTYDPAD